MIQLLFIIIVLIVLLLINFQVVTVSSLVSVSSTTRRSSSLSFVRSNNNNNKQIIITTKIRTTKIRTMSSEKEEDLPPTPGSTTTFLNAIKRNRGLEVNKESATPQPGGMIVYMKAGPDGVSVGDCPFAHYVRMVLEEKGLEYDIQPCVQATKPQWLIDHYSGSMPALRHRKECYIESDTIARYIDFFFQQQQSTSSSDDFITMENVNDDILDQAENALDGLFPAIAKFIKYTGENNDDTDNELYNNLLVKLNNLNDHFVNNVIPTVGGNDKPYYLTGANFCLLDCKIIPQLYTMDIATKEYKRPVEIPTAVKQYMTVGMQRPSFQKTAYDPSVAIWGWGNARGIIKN